MKNKLMFVFIGIVCVVLVGLLLVTGADAAPISTASRYVSPWTTVPAGETVFFQTDIGRALELMVWVKVAELVDCPMTVAVPSYDLPGRAIRVVSVTGNIIYIQNTGAESVQVQVVARP